MSFLSERENLCMNNMQKARYNFKSFDTLVCSMTKIADKNLTFSLVGVKIKKKGFFRYYNERF